ncbi:class II glutamine amidotransferase [Thermococcus thermotolerans]|uniref:class II glutamine amidotransferase n=1 Tax=Thermococcus thermotolerans TaxID=2969672 RepID=UPI002158573C|nr:class II glutamine amidotransferase [Thermococcus thermotolerans]
MCRILFATGEGREIVPLLDAIVKASENDPYKEKRGRGKQHRDGWGYVLLKDGTVRHYRSMRPIFEDAEAVKALRDELTGFVTLMVHSRAASQGVKSLFNVQPFAFSSRHGFTFWLLHNGDLDKSRIIELADLDEKELENVSDTYVFGAYLCRRLQSPTLSNLLVHYRTIEETTKSLFNTVTLFHRSGGDFIAFITARMSESYMENSLNYDYGKLLLLRRENLFAVVSSTLELYYPAEYEVVPNETAFCVRIREDTFEVETVHL